MKGVIPAAGKGSRLFPLTKAIPKEMTQVAGMPLIAHAIKCLQAANVDNIVIVTGEKKGALIDYVNAVSNHLKIKVAYVSQEEPKGLANAIGCAEHIILPEENFVVVFGDTILEPKSTMSELIKKHEKEKAFATILLYPVKDPSRYGVVNMVENGKIVDLFEKPDKSTAEKYKYGDTWYAISGGLVLNSKIFDYIRQTKPGAKGEFQITDSIKLALKDGKPIYGVVHKGLWFDVGTPETILLAEKILFNSKSVDELLKEIPGWKW